MRKKIFFLMTAFLTACVSRPPSDINNVCNLFAQYPSWYVAAKDVEKRWLIPVPVQMAIIHQESKFEAKARPPRTKLCWIIPWKRPSTAYGYSQALDGTWRLYKQSDGGFWASRTCFTDAVDFIGWYANLAHRRAGIPRDDPYALYLAYHEGVGGYEHKTYLKKPWLMGVAKKVQARSSLYRMQLNTCQKKLSQKSALKFW